MINNNIIKEYWIKNISKFKKIVNDIPYHDKGIWYTEAFLFCSICDLLNVDAIIESGVANGQSTEIFANYFNFNISAIDNDNYNIFQKTNTRLEKYNNFTGEKATYTPKSGRVLIFPSWLKHSVYPFYCDGERRSMSFNAYFTK